MPDFVGVLSKNLPTQVLAGVRISGHGDVDVIDKRASAIVDVIDGAVLTVGSANKLNVMALKPFDYRGAAECVIVLVVKNKLNSSSSK
jgi:hypothetical protein